MKGRVVEARKPDPIITDPVGCECLEKIKPLLPAELYARVLDREMPSTLARYLTLRAMKYDIYAKNFLQESPNGLVVSLGCGFDTRYWRVSKEPWKYVEVDLPQLIELKKEILGDIVTYPMIGCSVLEDMWIEEVLSMQRENVMFLAEGLFMYLPEEGVRHLFCVLSQSFSKSYIAFDVVNERYTRGLRKKIVEYKMKRYLGVDAGTSFQFGVHDAKDMESFGENIKVVEQWSYLQEKEVLPGFLWHLRNLKILSRGQYSIRAKIG